MRQLSGRFFALANRYGSNGTGGVTPPAGRGNQDWNAITDTEDWNADSGPEDWN